MTIDTSAPGQCPKWIGSEILGTLGQFWKSNPTATPSEDELKQCGICGPKKYFYRNINDPPICKPCQPEDYKNQYSEQCSEEPEGPNGWVQAQLDANKSGDLISELREWEKGDKDNPNAVFDENGKINCTPQPAMDTKEGRARACQVRNYYDKSEFPITNDELLIRFGEKKPGGLSSISGEISPERVLGDDYKGESQEKKYNDLRKKIHKERGANVKIHAPTMKKWKDYYNNECNPTQTPTPANLPRWCGEFDEDDFNAKGQYSIKFIVHEEAEEYENELFRNREQSDTPSYESEERSENRRRHYSEDCSPELSRVTNIEDINDCHIRLIRKRLKRLATLDPDTLSTEDEWSLLNRSESLQCSMTTDTINGRMENIMQFILSYTGFPDIQLDNNSENLSSMMDQFEPFIYPAIENILKSIKNTEEKCLPEGQISTTTQIIQTIFDSLKKQRKVTIDIPGNLSGVLDFEHEKFIKLISILIVAFLGIYVLLSLIHPPK